MYTGVGVSKRQRVVDALTERIHRGECEPGAKLAGEHQLAQEFSVSRSTIRQALAELQHRNLITTRSGLGSFVTFDGHTLDRRRGWAHTLAETGTPISTRILGIETIARSEHPILAEHCPTNSAVRIRRVRSIALSPDESAAHGSDASTTSGPDVSTTEVPISLEASYVPALGSLANLPQAGLRDDSLWASLADAGLVASRGNHTVDIHHLGAAEAELLKQEAGAAYLRSTRTSFSREGHFVEHVIALLDPSHFSLTLEFDDAS